MQEVALTREATEAECRHPTCRPGPAPAGLFNWSLPPSPEPLSPKKPHQHSPTHQGAATFKTRLPSPFFVTAAGTVRDRPPRVTVTR